MAGKAVAKVTLRAAVPTLASLAGPLQMGAVRGGGTAFPAMAAQAFLKRARTAKVPGAVVFFDLRADFYSVAPEVALGHLLLSYARLSLAGLTSAENAD